MLRHDWTTSPAEAIALQQELSLKVSLEPHVQTPRLIAGVDVSMNWHSNTIFAGIVVLSFPELEIIERVGVQTETTFPYIPGLLSFREIPALLQAWERLTSKPELLFVDGIGIAHPRRFGIASHLGVLLDLPTIGCAKSVLIGVYDEPGALAGNSSPLYAAKNSPEIVGAAVRTKNKVKPMFISPGHKLAPEQAAEYVLHTVRKHRLPEPTRQAHLYTNELRRAYYVTKPI